MINIFEIPSIGSLKPNSKCEYASKSLEVIGRDIEVSITPRALKIGQERDLRISIEHFTFLSIIAFSLYNLQLRSCRLINKLVLFFTNIPLFLPVAK